MVMAAVIREPLNVAEARRSPQWKEWQAAIKTEVDALRANDTFELVQPPAGAHFLDNTVQLRLKVGANGEIERYKARVCARGDRQLYLVDYVETHAPVADLVCVRVFLVLAVKFGMTMRQGDVPAAYLKAGLKETIYVKQVKGFEDPDQPSRVWRLNKALYGLKQAGRKWNHEIDGFLRSYGLQPTRGDPCFYYLKTKDGLLLVLLYVDDILIAHQEEEQVLRLLVALGQRYQVKDLGVPSHFLGIKTQRTTDAILLSQEAYVRELLHRFAMDPVRATPTPMLPKTRLDTLSTTPSQEETEALKNVPYRQVVGSLLYAARVTRPDISFATNQVG